MKENKTSLLVRTGEDVLNEQLLSMLFAKQMQDRGAILLDFKSVVPQALVDVKYKESVANVTYADGNGKTVDVVLVPELTAPTVLSLPEISKGKNVEAVYANGRCWRVEDGELQEFTQIGYENITIGPDLSWLSTDAKMVSCGFDYYKQLGVADFVDFQLNDISMLGRYCEAIGLGRKESAEVRKMIDNSDSAMRKRPDLREAEMESLESELGSYLQPKEYCPLLELMDIDGRLESMPDALSPYCDADAMKDFEIALRAKKIDFSWNFKLQRGLAIYGAADDLPCFVIEGIAPVLEEEGQVMGGGRYDMLPARLVSGFPETRCTGFGIGRDRTYMLLKEVYGAKASEVIAEAVKTAL